MDSPHSLQVGSALLRLSERTHVMGILNVTPDSFFDGGLYKDTAAAVRRGVEMAEQGADLIDVGGESTRPGSESVDVDEELSRVLPVIDALRGRVQIPLSIDTRKVAVAEAAIQAGASLVNDVGGLRDDPGMAEVVARHRVPVVIMHKRGTPKTMQDDTRYANLIGEVAAFFDQAIRTAEGYGIPRTQIILDPGIGFGKSLEGNLALLKNLPAFRMIGCPILVGVSRKSWIGQVLNLEPCDRIWGTASAVALAAFQGAHILRVHDVKEMAQVVRVADAVRRAGG